MSFWVGIKNTNGVWVEEAEEVAEVASDYFMNIFTAGTCDRMQALVGDELHAWGSSKTKPETGEIKRLQKKLELMNASEMTEDNKSEFLLVSKQLDDLLLKQEIFWRQMS